MNQIHNVLVRISHVEILPVISMTLFVIVFSGVLIYAASMKKAEVRSMVRMPFEDSGSDEGDCGR